MTEITIILERREGGKIFRRETRDNLLKWKQYRDSEVLPWLIIRNMEHDLDAQVIKKRQHLAQT